MCLSLASEVSEYACCCVDSTYCPGEECGVLIVDLQTRYQTRDTETLRHSLQLQMLIGDLEPQWAAVSCIYNLAICVVGFDQLYILHAVHSSLKTKLCIALLIMCVESMISIH